MVWQNCARAKWYNADGDTDYAAQANTPESGFPSLPIMAMLGGLSN